MQQTSNLEQKIILFQNQFFSIKTDLSNDDMVTGEIINFLHYTPLKLQGIWFKNNDHSSQIMFDVDLESNLIFLSITFSGFITHSSHESILELKYLINLQSKLENIKSMKKGRCKLSTSTNYHCLDTKKLLIFPELSNKHAFVNN